ncbi:MAG: UDP-N-acetylmuramoyl-L-alanine--D-glutamate ligase [Clostridia bacterium]|nr:UDP-N-acetylmuramoyl-L-alanine--D-glutamate ligase [Clostridia bacterium]
MKKDLLKSYINSRPCEILGLGVSNLPLAELICDMGVPLTVRDKKPLSELGDRAVALEKRGVRFITGADAFDTVGGGLIFRSPGIRPDRGGLPKAISAGAELTSEMELFLSLTNAETFAITGSDGKTTSTTLTGEFLTAEAERRQGGRVFIGGNIGEPLLHKVDGMGEADRAVMELSSFQLMRVKKAPMYSAITNVSPNHLDWHTGMDEYVKAKLNIVGGNTRRFVTNRDCDVTARIARELSERSERPDLFLFSSTARSFEEIFDFPCRSSDRAIYLCGDNIVISDGMSEEILLDTKKINVPGKHNVENFMTAIALTYSSVDASVYTKVAESFFGVRHRLELIRTLDGVDYFNSSIDSSPSRTAAALSALHGRDIVIICGGYDKHIPYEPLADSLCRSARAVVLTGATGKKIEAALLGCEGYKEGAPEYVYTPDFHDAVRLARSKARQGGCVLLSPASASFDAFPNFAVRGDTFRDIVNSFEEN